MAAPTPRATLPLTSLSRTTRATLPSVQRSRTSLPRASVAGALALVAGLLVTGCTTAPAAPPGGSPAASASPSAGGAPTVLGGAKPVAKQTLPSGIDDWRLARRTSSGTGSTAYVYGRPSDAAARLVATLTAVPLTSEALAVALPDQHTIGPATCGVLAGATASACYVPLSGGSLMVTGTPDLDALAALAGRLYDGLR